MPPPQKQSIDSPCSYEAPTLFDKYNYRIETVLKNVRGITYMVLNIAHNKNYKTTNHVPVVMDRNI